MNTLGPSASVHPSISGNILTKIGVLGQRLQTMYFTPRSKSFNSAGECLGRFTRPSIEIFHVHHQNQLNMHTTTKPKSMNTNNTPISMNTNNKPMSMHTNNKPMSVYTNNKPIKHEHNKPMRMHRKTNQYACTQPTINQTTK